MARGVNKVLLIGNLGSDPVVRYMPNGSAVANISLATSTSWRDKQSGELVEHTEWHRIVFFNRLAEIVGEYLRKGSKIYIEGSLRTRKWQDKSGLDRYTTEVVASEMQILEGRHANGNSTLGVPPANGQQQYSTDQQKGALPHEDPAYSGHMDDYEDDIPF